MSKEYLDRDEVHKIIDNNTEWNEDDTLKDMKLIDLEDQICQLKPKNQITKEKVIKVLDKQIWHLIKDNNLFTDFWHPASKDLFFGEIANEILEEE